METKKTDPGITWTTPTMVTMTPIEAFIATHSGHEIRVAATHPSGERNSMASYLLYSMYCPECGLIEGREHEQDPVVHVKED